MRIISKLICLVIFAIIGGIAVTPLAAAFVSESGTSNYIYLAFVTLLGLAIFLAPTGRRAWGRASLISGLLFVAMPFSMMALSGRVLAENSDTMESGAEMAGAAIGSGLMVGASMFVGFIAGAIFVVLSLVLLLGGRREVIVVERPAVSR